MATETDPVLVAIDPGLKGAWVKMIYGEDEASIAVIDFGYFCPANIYGTGNALALDQLMELVYGCEVVCERNWSGFGDGNRGSLASWSLATSIYSIAWACYLSDIPNQDVHFYAPMTWKSALGLLRKPKSASTELSKRLMPSLVERASSQKRKLRHDACEAALIGWYHINRERLERERRERKRKRK